MAETLDHNAKKIVDPLQPGEERLIQEKPSSGKPSPEASERLHHESSVYQIELELQNQELRAAQRALEASRRKYIDLYEFSPVGLLVLDQDQHIQDPNLTFATMLGITRHKLAEQDVSLFIDPHYQDAFQAFYSRLKMTQQPQQCEIVLLPASQVLLPIRLDGVALVQVGEPTTYRLSANDLTAQKQTEAQQLEAAAERQRIKVLSDFVRNLSQDIRTPITAAIMGLYIVGKTPDKEQQAEKIEELTQHLFQLNTVLDQLQHVAVLDNLVNLERRSENLNRLVTEVLHSYKARAVAKKVKLVHKLQDDLPEVLLDLNAMDRALRCLIDNALRFTPDKGTIVVQTYQRQDMIGLEIADNGTGIAGETLPHIFNRFYKAATSQQKSLSGAGLGLPMAKRIIELHHGSIEVTSTLGVKTVVSIKLPLK